MAYLLSGERPAVAAARINLVQSIVGWFANARAARAKRRALINLLDFDANMLKDIGIERADLFDALQSPRAGQTLAQRRAAASRNWLNP